MSAFKRPYRGRGVLPRPSTAALLIALAFAADHAFSQADAPSVVQLGDVVISAAGFEQDIVSAPASITVITRETLEQRQITSVADAVRGIEGVNVNALDARDGKTGNQSISLRGLPREYTLILIDGVRQNPMGNVTPNSFNDSQSVFIPPVAAIERIEVIRGPMATLYGSDALGGVVNIITRKPTAEWRGSASVGHTFQGDSDFGAKSTLEAYLAGPLVADTLSMQLYGRHFERRRSDIDIPGVIKPRPVTADTPTMGQNPVGAKVATAGGKLRLTPSARHELTLGFNVTGQTYDNKRGDVGALHNTGAAPSACFTAAAPNFCRGYKPELDFNRDQVTLGYVGRFDAGMLETLLTRDFLETKGRTIPFNSGLDPALEGSSRKLTLETYIFDTRFIAPLGAQHVLTVGGQYIDPKMTDGLWGGNSNRVKQYSLFAEDEWRVTDRLTLTGGLRYDDNEAFSGKWTPRVYAVWSATEQWTLKGGVGRGLRTPFLEQLTRGIIGFGSQGTVPLFGNPDLKPETSTNYEISAVFGGHGIAAQVTVFHNELKNLVEAGTGANQGRSLNIGEARIQGVELAASYPITRDVTLSGNYTYLDSKVTKTQLDTGNPAQRIASKKGDPLVSVPEHMANATLNWQATPRLNAFLNAEYRSSAFRPRNFHEPQNGGNGQGRVADGVRDSRVVLGDFKGYTLWNLGASYSINKNLRVNGVIYNLLDKDFNKYRAYTRCTNAGCTGPGTTAFSNVYNTIQEPRRLFVSLNADF